MYDEGQTDKEDYVRQIPDQLDQLGMALESLEKSIHGLEERLKPVLHDDLVEHGNPIDGKKEPEKLVAIAVAIKDRRLHIQAMIAKVNSLCKKIQI